MTPTEYIDAAKEKMGLSSDYELAKRLGIPNANLPGMRARLLVIVGAAPRRG